MSDYYDDILWHLKSYITTPIYTHYSIFVNKGMTSMSIVDEKY